MLTSAEWSFYTEKQRQASSVSCPQDQSLLFNPRQMKQKLYQSQQRAAFCSRASGEAEESRGEAEKSRALAEARALGCQRERDVSEADRRRLSEELQQLKKEVNAP